MRRIVIMPARRRMLAHSVDTQTAWRTATSIAVVKSSRNKAGARAWVRMILTSARARRLLEQAGFGLQ